MKLFIKNACPFVFEFDINDEHKPVKNYYIDDENQDVLKRFERKIKSWIRLFDLYSSNQNNYLKFQNFSIMNIEKVLFKNLYIKYI